MLHRLTNLVFHKSLHSDSGNSGGAEQNLRYLRLGAHFPSNKRQEGVCAAHRNCVVGGGSTPTEERELLVERNAVPSLNQRFLFWRTKKLGYSSY